MRRNGLFSLIFIVVLAVAGLTGTVASGNEPLLGLDLQGGVSVVLQPTEDTNDESLGQAIEIIRQRVDGLGVAEPEIARQGDAIVVQLPGVKDRERALELVGQTAELRFRPVLQVIPPELAQLDPEDLQPEETPEDGSTDGTEPDETTTTVAPDATTEDTTTDGADESGYGLAPGESAAPVQTDDTTTTAPAEDPAAEDPAAEDPAAEDLSLIHI